MIALLDLVNGVVVPTIHCYTIEFLKQIMDDHPDDYIKRYSYIFYMTCPDEKLNPFFNIPNDEKEEMISRALGIEFSLDDPQLQVALAECRNMYETSTSRAFDGIKTFLDNLAKFMSETQITTGRDGNLPAMTAAAKQYKELRASFKDVERELKEEQAKIRGDRFQAYDQR